MVKLIILTYNWLKNLKVTLLSRSRSCGTPWRRNWAKIKLFSVTNYWILLCLWKLFYNKIRKICCLIRTFEKSPMFFINYNYNKLHFAFLWQMSSEKWKIYELFMQSIVRDVSLRCSLFSVPKLLSEYATYRTMDCISED